MAAAREARDAAKLLLLPLLLLAHAFLAGPAPDPSDPTDVHRRAGAGAVHIERPALESFFPFHAAASDKCVPPREVEGLSVAVRRLIEGNVRVFPRNGFLLGIVRHGGFLPNEHVDADLGIVYGDLEGLPLSSGHGGETRPAARAAGFALVPKEVESYWRNWRGLDPTTMEPYKFLGANVHGMHGSDMEGVNLQANSVYAHGDGGRHFFPWLTRKENHEAALATAIRYNEEGADIRMLDTDEPLDAESYREEAQIGTVLDTDLTCFTERQFYHTTIPVPCDYDAILTSQYGRNWRHVESRGEVDQDDGQEVREQSLLVSEEDNRALLRGGPRPLCADEPSAVAA